MSLIEKLPKSKKANPPTVPFSLKIFKRCIEYGVSIELVKHLHLFDLQCLLIQFDIQKVQEYLNTENTKKLREQGIGEVRDISGSEAIKFLGR